MYGSVELPEALRQHPLEYVIGRDARVWDEGGSAEAYVCPVGIADLFQGFRDPLGHALLAVWTTQSYKTLDQVALRDSPPAGAMLPPPPLEDLNDVDVLAVGPTVLVVGPLNLGYRVCLLPSVGVAVGDKQWVRLPVLPRRQLGLTEHPRRVGLH